MNRANFLTAIGLIVAVSLPFGCANEPDRPGKALIVTGAEELAGAQVSLDGVALGSLEPLEKTPELILWAVSRVTGNESLNSSRENVALIDDLEGTQPGDHLIVINHPDYQPIEKPFNDPESLVINREHPETGVVHLACTRFDLIPASG